MNKQLLMMALLVVAAIGCKKENDGIKTYEGPSKPLHHGKAWTWVQLDASEKPERVAISIDDAALNSVPVGPGNGNGGHEHDDNVALEFHSKIGASPFRHVWLNWNRNGHEPQQVYGIPHFDLHYYMVSVAERESFTDNEKLDADPAPNYLPANHIGVHPLPTMGKHWIDLTSPELDPVNPKIFTQTFIFGSYDSKVVFYEPMITLAFLKNATYFERPLPVPAKFQKSGYYPTRMVVQRKNGYVDVILDRFVYRTAS